MTDVIVAAQEAGAVTAPTVPLWLLIVVPLVGSAVLLLAGRRSDRWGHLLATAVCGATFVMGLVLLSQLLGLGGEDRRLGQQVYEWIPVGDLQVDFGLLLDPLSVCFVLLITGVGTLVHVYSIGYMDHDEDRRRFFAYLNLFIAAMLLLVLADSYLLLYVGWEGVGLASMLLIGFWGHVPEYATAAKKAFVVNRVGDVGLGLAVMAMFATIGAVGFDEVRAAAGQMSSGTVTAICLLLLLAAAGKSAQFPLHVWLPDAMAGPTPASALIHAATMVTAGVYLVARSSALFDLSPAARTTAMWMGVITILIGAVIACAQDDLKKVLAYSTISQIGYMMLGVGIGKAGYALGIFHLLTHGFFKALMFLGAGSVMHGLHNETDMRRMGNLRKHMKLTWLTFTAGWLAIIGFPLTAGFFSKDQILETSFLEGHFVLWALALLGAGLTAFYMSRLYFMTFWGSERFGSDVHPHESPAVMTVPLAILAVLSLVGGAALNWKAEGQLAHFLEPVFGSPEAHHDGALTPIQLTIITLLVVAAGAGLAFLRYARQPVPVTAPVAVLPTVTWARKKLYFDTIYESVVMRPGQYLARTLVFVDGRGVDGAVNGAAALVGGSSGRLRRIQTGFVRSYALGMLGGAVVLVAALVLVRF
ncbi:MAG TPA: NADH-quinone oxidoreductase subunit L [Mycobacteriales bacterium]|nr:NADH-quinone oxidoreductase subunit L [Mycobacteriales bacterium]